MKSSIKIIFTVVAMAAIMFSCKKIDGPVPSTKVLLTAKTWTATSYTSIYGGPSQYPSPCNGFVAKFGSDGIFYNGNGCNTPSYAGLWTISDQVVTFLGGGTLTVNSISATNMNATLSGVGPTPLIVEFTGN
jgi:heat shock protein HslJ